MNVNRSTKRIVDGPIPKEVLVDLYVRKGMSKREVAKELKCSLHKVSYWMDAHIVHARTISEAIYLMNNPDGDPFTFNSPKNVDEAKLFGMGIGLYWGEGTKADKNSVRLGNSDPKLLLKFIEFLLRIFNIKREDLRFGLQVFTDISADLAMDFWVKSLRISKRQFYKPTISKSIAKGTYRKKAQYGVLTVYYHNKKLRDLLVSMLPM